MSSRDSGMWYCYECQSEMHAERHPDPICSVCHSSFVEEVRPIFGLANFTADPTTIAQSFRS
ncbi:hypothetical protein CALVIDRAFT_543479 [Calocera viscosa TUFC12733]|uniref:Uncharacterized protein n=1 Tax=Calocera viscosa (strain TUFC12733) TaxID=1330018 RepID=A0A167FIZ3_CALVF|nr:hypothetical protein CALVIDRAFT_543479 [Calocera viscosa TUFC12733]